MARRRRRQRGNGLMKGEIMDLDTEDSDSRTTVLGRKRKLPDLFLDADDGAQDSTDKRQKADQNAANVFLGKRYDSAADDLSPALYYGSLVDPRTTLENWRSNSLRNGSISLNNPEKTRLAGQATAAANVAYDGTSTLGASSLRELSHEDRDLQHRYFQITDLDAPVRCLG